MPRVDFDRLTSDELGEPSETIRARVIAAAERQWQRFAGRPSANCNAQMRVPNMRAWCHLDAAGAHQIRTAVERLGLSARADHRVLFVAQIDSPTLR